MQNKYRSIAKGSAIFGGTQIYNILIGIVRGKLVAMLLGPEGMGIASLLNSAALTIQQFSSFGINLSIVKEIAEKKDNEDRISLVMYTARKLLKFTALVGAFFTILFSTYLSEITFGSTEYKWHFVFLSIMIFFTTLGNGETSILQGFQALKKLALSSIIGSTTGLIVGIPLYYFLGYNGIVPAMIILSLVTYMFYRYNTKKIILKSNNTYNWEQVKPLVKTILSLGVIMMAASLLGSFCNFALNAFIRKFGSLYDVGYFQAANTITNQYIGIVFTAMSLDYFPRLSAISSDNNKVRELVNTQSELVILAIIPLAVALILFAPLIVKILLTDNFQLVVPIIRFFGIGIIFKAISYPLGYISFSKGDKKFFFYMEGLLGNILTLFFNCVSFYFYGIIGLGISFILSYLTYLVIIRFLTGVKYEFKYNDKLIPIIIISVLLPSIALLASYMHNALFSYAIMGLVFIVTITFSIVELNKRLSFFK